MILDEPDYERFDHLSASERGEAYEQDRIAPPRSPTAQRCAVEGRLSSICQEVYAASWIDGFEAEVWAMLRQGEPAGTGVYDRRVTAAAGDLAELRRLTLEAGWWPVFDHPDPDLYDIGRVITVDQARHLYDDIDTPGGQAR